MNQTMSLIISLALILTSEVPAWQLESQLSGGKVSAGTQWSELVAGMDKMHTATALVRPSGVSDIDFVHLMIPHHQAAIDMARTQLLYGTDPEMRRLAQEIITDQQSEITLMQLWLERHPPASAHKRP